MALLLDEPALTRAVGQGLVLQGALPPLSQMGQSSGWLARRNSNTPSCAFLTFSDVVPTTIPSATGMKHAGCRVAPRGLSTSTRHMRHMPTGAMRGW